MKSIWIGHFDNKEIKVENTWLHGERLFVNGVLQDETFGFASTKLLGHVTDQSGNKLGLKANIGGFLKITCSVFVDDKKVLLVQQK